MSLLSVIGAFPTQNIQLNSQPQSNLSQGLQNTASLISGICTSTLLSTLTVAIPPTRSISPNGMSNHFSSSPPLGGLSDIDICSFLTSPTHPRSSDTSRTTGLIMSSTPSDSLNKITESPNLWPQNGSQIIPNDSSDTNAFSLSGFTSSIFDPPLQASDPQSPSAQPYEGSGPSDYFNFDMGLLSSSRQKAPAQTTIGLFSQNESPPRSQQANSPLQNPSTPQSTYSHQPSIVDQTPNQPSPILPSHLEPSLMSVFLSSVERAAQHNPGPSGHRAQASYLSIRGKDLAHPPYGSGESPSLQEGVLQKPAILQSPHSNQYESSSDPTPRSHTKRKKSENKSNPSLKFIQNGMTEPVLSSRRKKQKIDTSSIAKKDNPINTEISNPGARALPLSSPDPEKYSKVSDCYSTQDLCKERGINKEMLATALTKHRLGLNFKTKTAFAKHLSVGRSLVSNAENTGLDDFPSRPSLEKFATGLNYESGIEFLNAIKKSQSAPQSQPDAPLNLNLSGNRTRNKTKVSDCYSTQDLCNERGINKEMLATALTKHRLDLNFKKKAAFADHLRVGRSLVSDAENTDLDDFPSRPSLEKFATGLNYESGIEFLNAIKKSQSAPQSQPDAPLNLNLSGNRTRNKTDDSKFGFSKKIFANFIIDRRKKLGFEGQSKFAKMVGIKKQTYNNIENSTMQRTFGSPDNQTKIADGLGYESLSTFFKAIKDSQSVTSQSQPETV